MEIARLRAKRQWNRLGKTDPLWAVLTDGEKKGHGWDAELFFETGREEIESTLVHARTLGLPLRAEQALDFGCGVGRLTQAIGQHFRACVGVDIAPSMIESAQGLNRFPDKCRYHLNTSRRLQFDDQAFSFVYSALVLQHNPPEVSKECISELIRVLEWGGLLVFQLPSRRVPEHSDSAAVQTSPTGPLPASAMRARIYPAELERRIVAGEPTAIKLGVQNHGNAIWPSGRGRRGRYEVRVGSHWLSKGGEMLSFDGPRTDLPRDIGPGEQADIFVEISAPVHPGEYILEFDVVQERVAWFTERGSDTARVAITVLPAREAQRHPSRAWKPPARRQGLRPRAALVALMNTLLGAGGYMAVRHGVLDAAVSVAELAKFAKRCIGKLKDVIVPPPMDMYGIPRPEAEACIAAAGGTLLWTESCDMAHDGWQAYRYWVTRWPCEVQLAPGRRAALARIEPVGELRPAHVAPGASVSLPIRLTNLGSMTWPASGEGPVEVFVGGRTFDPATQHTTRDFCRVPLPRRLGAGDSVELEAVFPAPSEAGRHMIRLDVVIERFTWMETHGTVPLCVEVNVAGDRTLASTTGS